MNDAILLSLSFRHESRAVLSENEQMNEGKQEGEQQNSQLQNMRLRSGFLAS